MAIIKAVNSWAGLARAINYIASGGKTECRLTGGHNCSSMYAIEEMRDTKEAWRKTGGSTNTLSRVFPRRGHYPARSL
ncbi:hypothetical protein CE91St36_01860 [Christensenellaceae bacterium]|nr:hypothetical protein CE91St36_01860 [Christensenellaceae bacterium]BDF60037.1 hypothetical protein CE91St37_01870 [Christensenellaceae bacterium]